MTQGKLNQTFKTHTNNSELVKILQIEIQYYKEAVLEKRQAFDKLEGRLKLLVRPIICILKYLPIIFNIEPY